MTVCPGEKRGKKVHTYENHSLVEQERVQVEAHNLVDILVEPGSLAGHSLVAQHIRLGIQGQLDSLAEGNIQQSSLDQTHWIPA